MRLSGLVTCAAATIAHVRHDAIRAWLWSRVAATRAICAGPAILPAVHGDWCGLTAITGLHMVLFCKRRHHRTCESSRPGSWRPAAKPVSRCGARRRNDEEGLHARIEPQGGDPDGRLHDHDGAGDGAIDHHYLPLQ